MTKQLEKKNIYLLDHSENFFGSSPKPCPLRDKIGAPCKAPSTMYDGG